MGGTPMFYSIFPSKPHQNTLNLIRNSNNTSEDGNPPGFVFRFFRRFISREKMETGSRTEEEEKVCSWLYALAQSEKNMAFEYVRSTERGLSFSEAERRLRENGPNVPFDHTFPGWWQILWVAFFHPFNIILIVLSILSYIASDNPNGCIMLLLVFISVSLRFYQEHSSSKAAMKLSEFVRCPIKVQRCAGRVVQTELIVQVDQRDVVPGDIVVFEPGDLFPGDVRLLSSKNLVVSQSSLTGEPWTVEKTAHVREDRNTSLLNLKNICFMGTNVVSGGGTGLVISTGSKTYMSTMFLNVGKKKPPDCFEIGIRRISYALVGLMLIVVTFILVTDYCTSDDLSESILFALSVACALTPQMLPLIVNTSLAKGALAMAKDRCVVKSLPAIRGMGSMDILCIDKTGTLTMDHAIMVSHLDSYGLQQEKVLCFGFLNSYFKTDQKYPLDDAILAYVYTNGYKFQPSKWKKIDEIPFDFIRRRVSIILEMESSRDRFLVTKGALDEVIKVCSWIDRVDRNEVTKFVHEDRRRILNIVEDLSNEGLRVIGVGLKRLEHPTMEQTDDHVESDMVFLGLITFYDPPKDSAKQALRRLTGKGVKPKLLTGDTLTLSIKICKQVGIETNHVTTGPELDLLTPESFHDTVDRATVLAHLTPSQKLRVVQSLQTVGKHIVGFLGDGVNDSLALDAADVGISVDSGAAVAKDFADIILLKKDLNVLIAGVEQGRLTFGNTMKYVKSSVIANIGSVFSLLIATLFLGDEPLTPNQLLTQSFIFCIGQIAIPWDKTEEDYLKTPQRWSENGLPMFILWNGPLCTVCDLATLLFLMYYYKVSKTEVEFFRSAWFVEGILMQTLIFHLIRTEKVPFVQEVASWPVLVSTMLVLGVGMAIPFTEIGDVMKFVELPLSYFGFLVVLFVGYFVVGQVVKKVYVLIYKRWL